MSDLITQNIAATLKQLRADKGWSLDKTSQHTNVSKAMLGQIERGESSPTIATLWKIATGLECSFSRLLGDVAQQSAYQGDSCEQGMSVQTLFPFSTDTNMEMFQLDIVGGYERVSEPHATGVVEHIHVLSGELEILSEGQWHRLSAGQQHKLAADREHGYRGIHPMTQFIDVIVYQGPKMHN